ncbi:MAG: SoxR reducing system RseC family protein [Sulfuriferula sp.]|nr:SoxR reducing system RseC family protein [Sulfuriferula sp.]
MIEMQARVIAVEQGAALVEPMTDGSCSICTSSSGDTSAGGCGADKIGQLFTLKTKQYRVIDPIGSRIGDAVVIGIQDGAVLRGSAAVYMLPLLLVFIGATLAAYLAPDRNQDVASIAGAAAGFALGALWLFRFSRNAGNNPQYQPVVLRSVRSDIFVLKEIKS